MTTRRLAAILAADMVGYSRLIERDEGGTVARLKADRGALIDPLVAEHGGHIIRLAGDGALVEFSSVVEATRCAIAIQSGMARRNAGRSDHERIVFRMGVNIGDIVVESDNLHGDGINVAARLEALAPPGGIFVSEEAARHVDGKVDAALEFVEERQVKNISRPIRIWQVLLDTEPGRTRPTLATAAAAPSRPRWLPAVVLGVVLVAGALGWWAFERAAQPQGAGDAAASSRPTLAVLPFTNLSADPAQEYFVDGMTEDMITDLSMLKGLSVIARNSTFAYRGQSVDVREVGRLLGAHYVLEGSVRKVGDRVRVNAQLIDASIGTHLWADRFDEQMTDVFAMQDRVIRRIVTALSLKLTPTEDRKVGRSLTEVAEAYDLFLRGQNIYLQFMTDRYDEARRYYRRAIALDPKFARAYGALAITYVNEVLQGVSNDRERTLRQALDLGRTALGLDPELPQAHFVLAYVSLFQKDLASARAAAERALELAPSYADALALLGFIHMHAGNTEQAFARMNEALRLNPAYPMEYLNILATIHYVAGNYEKAVELGQQVKDRNPTFVLQRVYHAAALAALGRLDDAAWEAQEVQVLVPDFSVRKWVAERPFANPDTASKMSAALLDAGLPP